MILTLALVKKNILSIFRNFKTHIAIFLLPIIFMGVTALAYGQPTKNYTFTVAVIENENQQFEKFQEGLFDIKNGNDKNLFLKREYKDLNEAKLELERLYINLIIVWDSDDDIKVYGDPADLRFNSAFNYLSDYSIQYFGADDLPITIESVYAENQDSNFSAFDYLTPGLIIFGILIMIPQVAQVVSEEALKRYTFRYYTARVNGFHIILSFLISQTILALIQTTILFSAAIAFGFNVQGSILVAYLVAIPTAIFVVGLGLVIGSFANTPATSSGIGVFVAVIFGLLSGSFLKFPEIKITDRIMITDLVPTSHSSEALRQVLQFNHSADTIFDQILIVSISAIIVLFVGAYIYQNQKLKNLG